MNDSTRRGFLTAAGLGTAAGVAAVAAPTAGAEEVRLPAGANGAMAAYIHDLKKSEVAIMVKGREVVVTDKQLVARLASAFARASKSVGR
jgi:predicted nicotinamide N-methyase